MSNIDILRSIDDLLSFRTQDLLLLANSLGVSTNDDILVVAEKVAKRLLQKARMPSPSFELFQEMEKFINVKIRMCGIIGGLNGSEIDALVRALASTNIPQTGELYKLMRENKYSELRKELCGVFGENIANKNVYNKFIDQLGKQFMSSLDTSEKVIVENIVLPDRNIESALEKLPEAKKDPYSRLNLGGYNIPVGKPVGDLFAGERPTEEEMMRPVEPPRERALGNEPGQVKFIGADYDIPFPRRKSDSTPTEIRPVVTPKRKKRFGLF